MNAKDLFKAAMEIDLTSIKTKLMHVESGEGWSLQKANAVEKEYLRFLCLMKLYPEEDTAPLVDVDTFWHYHILDTMKYAIDCEQFFGYFLHHYPYVGLRGEDDERFRLDSGARMRSLYEATFDQAYPASGVDENRMMQIASGGTDSAFCAGPHAGNGMPVMSGEGAFFNATAFCAGPHGKNGSLQNDENVASKGVAFCAGPHVKAGSDLAFCAGPHVKLGETMAFCAGPHAKMGNATAFCAGPHTQLGNAHAFCAGPHKKNTTLLNQAAVA